MPDHVFNLHPSKLYFSLLITMTLLSAMCILIASLSIIAKIMLIFLLSAYSLRLYYCASIAALKIESSRWFVKRGEAWIPLTLRGDSTLSRIVTALRFQEMGKKRLFSSVIWCDSLSKDNYRRLQVAARFSINDQPAAVSPLHQSPQK